MKKIIITIWICLITISCSSEKSVQKDITVTMQNIARNPESVSISDVKIIYESKNYVVADFTFRGQNGFGGYSISSYEYVRANDVKSVFIFDSETTNTMVLGAESSIREKDDISRRVAELTIATNLFKYMHEAIYSESVK